MNDRALMIDALARALGPYNGWSPAIHRSIATGQADALRAAGFRLIHHESAAFQVACQGCGDPIRIYSDPHRPRRCPECADAAPNSVQAGPHLEDPNEEELRLVTPPAPEAALPIIRAGDPGPFTGGDHVAWDAPADTSRQGLRKGDIMTGRQLYNAVKAAGAQLIDGPDHPASGWDTAAQLLTPRRTSGGEHGDSQPTPRCGTVGCCQHVPLAQCRMVDGGADA